jgi:sortase (surface protein transpeptidase)
MVSRRGKGFIDKRISQPVGLTNEGGKRVLYPPVDTVGWYKEGRWQAKPGYPGPSVLVAHISYHGKPGPFWLLPEVRKGDQIMVTYSSGDKVTFVVTGVEHTEKIALPVDKIWIASNDPVLWLVTCDPDTPFRNGHYAGNVLVRAVPVVG